jgi:hypothetical protein
MVEAIANLQKELTEYGVAASRGASTTLASWVRQCFQAIW